MALFQSLPPEYGEIKLSEDHPTRTAFKIPPETKETPEYSVYIRYSDGSYTSKQRKPNRDGLIFWQGSDTHNGKSILSVVFRKKGSEKGQVEAFLKDKRCCYEVEVKIL